LAKLSNLTCRIHYEIPAAAGEFVASLGGLNFRRGELHLDTD
jgi:hypothetical protein